MSRTFDDLILAYGVAEFALGQLADAGEPERELARAKRNAAHAELVKALRRAGLPVGAVAVVA